MDPEDRNASERGSTLASAFAFLTHRKKGSEKNQGGNQPM
jgi:hypothetical protein